MSSSSSSSSDDSSEASNGKPDPQQAPTRPAMTRPEPQTDDTSPWEAPAGFTLSSKQPDMAFTAEAIATDPNLELWLVKIPTTVKSKYLKDAQVEVDSLRSSVQVKKATYEFVDTKRLNLPSELLHLVPLLPSKSSSGTLVPCKKPIAKFLSLQHPNEIDADLALEEEIEEDEINRHPLPPHLSTPFALQDRALTYQSHSKNSPLPKKRKRQEIVADVEKLLHSSSPQTQSQSDPQKKKRKSKLK